MKKMIVLFYFLNVVIANASGTMPGHLTHALSGDKKVSNVRLELVKADLSTMQRLLAQYEVLHMAFFNQNADEIVAGAGTLANTIDELKNVEVKKLLRHIQKKLRSVDKSKLKEHNNESMHQTSKALVYVLNHYKVGNQYSEYYCPMVKKAWIQNTHKMAQVRNPYASKNMPSCGSMMTK